MADPATARAVLGVATSMHVSANVRLALAEACIVESGCRNLDHGDRDSLGVLQQRANWGSVAERMNPAVSAQKFLSRAVAVEKQHPAYTAGMIAQKVQVSAFPLRYDACAPAATILIAQYGNGPAVGSPLDPGMLNHDSGGITGAVDNAASIAAALKKLQNPKVWVQALYVLLGVIMILIGVLSIMEKPATQIAKVAGAVIPEGRALKAVSSVTSVARDGATVTRGVWSK